MLPHLLLKSVSVILSVVLDANGVKIRKSLDVVHLVVVTDLVDAFLGEGGDGEEVSPVVMGDPHLNLAVVVGNLNLLVVVAVHTLSDCIVNRFAADGCDSGFAPPKSETAVDKAGDIVFLAAANVVHILVELIGGLFLAPFVEVVGVLSLRLNVVAFAVFLIGFVLKLKGVGVHKDEPSVLVIYFLHSVVDFSYLTCEYRANLLKKDGFDVGNCLVVDGDHFSHLAVFVSDIVDAYRAEVELIGHLRPRKVGEHNIDLRPRKAVARLVDNLESLSILELHHLGESAGVLTCAFVGC